MKCKQNTQTVILNLIQDLQRLPLLLMNDMRGRFQIKFGMTSLYNNGGFTLIELLVVVLIIGILAAVAVPQYKKVIMKQHVTQMKTIAKQFIRAENLYRLENGNNTPDIDALAVKVPSDPSFYIYGVTDYKGQSTEYYTIVIRSLKYNDSAMLRFYKRTGYTGNISWGTTFQKIANEL